MLAPVSAIRPATAAIAGGLQRRAEHGHVGAALAAGCRLSPVPAVDLDAHVRGRAAVSSTRVAQPLPVARRGDQHAEDQPAAEHDLLDVETSTPDARQGREDRGGDAGPVLAGQRDQQGLGARGRSSIARRGYRVPRRRGSVRRPDLRRAGGDQGAPGRRAPAAAARRGGARSRAADRAAVVLEREVDDRQRLQRRGAASSTQRGGHARRERRPAARWRRFISRSATSGRQRATSRRGQRVGGLEQRRRAAPGRPRRRRAAGGARRGVGASTPTAAPDPARHQPEAGAGDAPRPRRPRAPRR